jgi:hypothetical protein
MDRFSNPRDFRYKEEIETTLVNLFNAVLDEYAEADVFSEDTAEAVDSSTKLKLEAIQVIKDFLQDKYTGNIFNDVMTLTQEGNLKFIAEELINLYGDPQNLSVLLDDFSKDGIKGTHAGVIKHLSKFSQDFVKASFFSRFNDQQDLKDDGTFDYRLGRSFLTSKYSKLSRVNRLGAPELGLDARGMVDFYRNLVKDSYSPGLVSGYNIGRAMLGSIVGAKESVQIGMFQMEHGILLDALRLQQELGTKVNLMLSPPQKRDGAPQEVGFFNVIARNLLGGTSVEFDKQVMEGVAKAGYAHYKFLGVDLESSLENRKVMIGSFNMTRGALGQIIDQSRNLVSKHPHNFELGFLIDYGLVKNHGLRKSAFERITKEAKDYAGWLFNRGNDRLKPLGYNPEHILSGPQTYEKIRQALGFGDGVNPENLTKKVNAFFALNVITDRGMGVDSEGRPTGRSISGNNPQEGFYHTLEQKLRASTESKITILISSNFKGIRNQNIGGSQDAFESGAFKALQDLKRQYQDRLEIIETHEHIHAKTALIYGESGELDIISGSANVSGQGFGGESQDVGLYLSSKHFVKASKYLEKQAENVLGYLQTLAVRPVLRKSLVRESNAISETLMRELKLRLSPELMKRVTFTAIQHMGSDGEIYQKGTRVSISLNIKGVRGKGRFYVANALSFDVFEYLGEPTRLYIPQLYKIIDPVLGMHPEQRVNMDPKAPGSTGMRGALTVQEFSAAAVVAAGIDSAYSQLNSEAAKLTGSYSEHILDKTVFARMIKKSMKEGFRETFKNFEGLPLGQSSHARSFKRLIFGLTVRELSKGTSLSETEKKVLLEQARLMGLNKTESGLVSRILRKVAALFGFKTPDTKVASLLDLSDYPEVDPHTLDRSFYLDEFDYDTDLMGNKIQHKANAPSEVIRVLENGTRVEKSKLRFTVLAQSLSHEAPANIFITEGFNELYAFNYDSTAETLYGFLNAAKPDALPQRQQNMLGSDTGLLTVTGSAAEYIKKVKLKIKGPEKDSAGNVLESRARFGNRFNILLMNGMGESTFMNSKVMNGAYVTREIKKTKSYFTGSVGGSITNDEISFIDQRLKRDKEGNWTLYDPKSKKYERVSQEDGKPLLTIDIDQRNIKLLEFFNSEGVKTDSTMPNPIYDMSGHKLEIMDIQTSMGASGKLEIEFNYRVLSPAGGSMRILSSGLKMVTVGVKGGFFDVIAGGINKSIESLKSEDLTYRTKEGGSLSLGTYGEFYQDVFTMWGKKIDPSMSEKQKESMTGEMIHLMVGESIVKTGVVFLQTAAIRLEEKRFYSRVVDIFSDDAKFDVFKRMLESFEKQSESAKKGTGINRTILKGINHLLGGSGLDEVKLTEELKQKNRKNLLKSIRSIRNKLLRGDDFGTVLSSISDKHALTAAAALHVMQSMLAGVKADSFMEETSRRLSGAAITPMNEPQFDFSTPVPLVLDDAFSVKAFPMSNRMSALMPGNQAGSHTQTVLGALSRNLGVEKRDRQLSELFSLAYLGGSATQIAQRALGKKSKVSIKDLSSFHQDYMPSLLIGGVNFEPLAYAFAGMSREHEAAFGTITDSVRRLTYEDLSPEEIKIEEAKAIEAVKSLGTPGTRIAQNFSSGVQSARSDMKIFELMKKYKVGSPRMRIPVFEFTAVGSGRNRFSASNLVAYEEVSLLSAETLTELQGVFSDFSSEIFDLHVEAMRGLHKVRALRLQMAATGGLVTKETRDQYLGYLDKIRRLQSEIENLAATDVQKSGANIIGGFAVIANFIPGFHNMKLGEDQNIRTFETSIIVGDEVMMRVMNKAEKAMKAADSLVDRKEFKEKLSKKAQKAMDNHLKKVTKAADVKFEAALLESTDDAKGYTSKKSGVGKILEGFTNLGADYYKKMSTISSTSTFLNSLINISEAFETIYGVQISGKTNIDDVVKTFTRSDDTSYFRTQGSQDFSQNIQQLKALKHAQSVLGTGTSTYLDSELQVHKENILKGVANTIKALQNEKKYGQEVATLAKSFEALRKDLFWVNRVKELKKIGEGGEFESVQEARDIIFNKLSKVTDFIRYFEDTPRLGLDRDIILQRLRKDRDKLLKEKSIVDTIIKKEQRIIDNEDKVKNIIRSIQKKSQGSTLGEVLSERTKVTEENGEKKKSVSTEVIGSFGQANVDLLRVQLSIFENKARMAGLSKGVADVLHDTIRMKKFEIALYENRLNPADLRKGIDTLKNLINSTNNMSDKKYYGKMLDVAQYRLEVSTGTKRSKNNLIKRSAEDVSHALYAAGFSVLQAVEDESSQNSFGSEDETVKYVRKVQNLLGVSNVKNALQLRSYLRGIGLESAYSRAGAPLGSEGGVKSAPIFSIREGNRIFRQLGTSFELDEKANRRSIFLHMSGMALNLGDFDGDVAILTTIERYTFLEHLKHKLGGEDNLIDVERSAKELIKQLEQAGADKGTIDEYRLLISKQRDPLTNNLLNLKEEYLNLKTSVTDSARRLVSTHIAEYWGLGENGLSKLAANYYGNAYTDPDADKELLEQRLAVKLNKFSSDMYSSLREKASKLIDKKIAQSDNFDKTAKAYEALQDNEEYRKHVREWVNKDSGALVEESLGDLKNIFSTIAGVEMSADEILRFGIKTAFASTKLIGNFSNLQNTQHALSTMSKFASQKFYTDVINTYANVSGGDIRAVAPEIESHYQQLQKEKQETLNIIVSSNQGFMQRLQQATRDAIKPKTSGATSESNKGVLQELYEDSVLIRAIDASVALVTGKSLFGNSVNYSFNSANEQKILRSLNVNELIKIETTPDGSTRATLKTDYDSSLKFIVDELLDPLVRASKDEHRARALLQERWKGKELDAAQKDALTNIDIQAETQALMYGKLLINQFQDIKRILKYRKAAESAGEDGFERARFGLSRQLKLVFLQEHMRGGRLNTPEAFQRVVGDVYQDYAKAEMLDSLESDARALDPTGRLYDSLLPAFSKYAQGENELEIYKALVRKNPEQYTALGNIHMALVEAATGQNPLETVQQVMQLREEKVKEVYAGQIEKKIEAVGKAKTVVSMAIGGFLVMGGLAATEAHAATTDKDKESPFRDKKDSLTKVITETIFNWEPHLTAASIYSQQGFDTNSKLVAIAGLTATMAAAHVATGFSERLVKKAGFRSADGMTFNKNLEHAGGLLGVVSAVFAGSAISGIQEEFMKREMRTPVSNLATQITEELATRDAIIMASSEDITDLTDQEDAVVELAYDENGDAIPVPEGLTRDEALNMSDENHSSVPMMLTERDNMGIPEVYKNPVLDENGKVTRPSRTPQENYKDALREHRIRTGGL